MKKVTTRYLDGQKEKSVAELHWDETLTEQENRLINLYPEVQYQTIQGFGGAFTDARSFSASWLTTIFPRRATPTRWAGPPWTAAISPRASIAPIIPRTTLN